MTFDLLLSQTLKALRLPTITRLWKELSDEALEKGWTPAEYLNTLCEYELSEREGRKLARNLAQSQLPKSKSLESYDFSVNKELNKSQIFGLSSGELWIKEAKNLLIFGQSGTGKTHLAAGIGEKLIEAGYRVLFSRTTELLQKLEAAKRDLSLPAALDKLDKYDCLILDDFGYVKRSEMETSLLFELICERYERRSLIITSNQSFREWGEIFEDKKMAIAAIDRLVHHSFNFNLKGESYRKRAAQENLTSS